MIVNSHRDAGRGARRGPCLRLLVAAAVAVLLAVGSTAAFVEPASAGLGSGNPTMAVSATTVPSDRATDVTVTGTDFLVPPHDCPNADVFGGVYVMFGWVASASGWGPSARNSENNAGVYGYTYAYPGEGGDANLRDDGSGRVRLVSFTSGGESGAATPFHMDCDGGWTTVMTIHSPVFQYVVPSTGEVRTVDCRSLTVGSCGILSIGAHGKSSATNERFVPITFTGGAPATVDTGSSGPSGSSGSRSDGSTGGPSASGDPSSGSEQIVEEVVEVASPFEADAAGGSQSFPGLDGESSVLASRSGAAGVPGASAGSPVAIAVARGDAAVEPARITDIGRVPRWLVPTGVILLLAAVGGSVWFRRRNDSRVGVVS